MFDLSQYGMEINDDILELLSKYIIEDFRKIYSTENYIVIKNSHKVTTIYPDLITFDYKWKRNDNSSIYKGTHCFLNSKIYLDVLRHGMDRTEEHNLHLHNVTDILKVAKRDYIISNI
jgi:hypothetical protein